jgi:hypothetical protein
MRSATARASEAVVGGWWLVAGIVSGMEKPKKWRVGRKVPLNVYAGNRPVCQCHNPGDARLIVDSVNAAIITNAALRVRGRPST